MSKWISAAITGGKVRVGDHVLASGDGVGCGMGSVTFFYRGNAVEVVRYSSTGRERWRQVVRKDGEWRIGADRMFRVVQPAEETDPVRRFLRVAGVPIKVLKRHEPGESVRIQPGYTYDPDQLRTDGHVDRILVPCYPKPVPEDSVTGGTYAVLIGWRHFPNGGREPRINAVHVWGNPDVEPLAKIIAEWLRGKDATADLFELTQEQTCAWAAERIGSGPKPWLVRTGSVELSLRFETTSITKAERITSGCVERAQARWLAFSMG